MKKLILAVVILFVSSTMVVAAEEEGKIFTVGNPNFGSGTKLVNLGVGFLPGYGASIGGEYRIEKLFDMEAFGVGGILAIWRWTEGFVGYDWTYTDIRILANFFFHFGLLGNIFKTEKLDEFFVLGIGPNISSWKWDYDLWGVKYSGSDSKVGVTFYITYGLRYYLNEKIAIGTNLGAGLGIFSISASIKL